MRIICLILCFLSLPAFAQENRNELVFEQAVIYLSSASSIEELSEDEIERYRYYWNHPLAINRASRSRLISSGLLSQYRVATLLDYRSRCGDVLSWTELSAIDGFNREFVSVLSNFVSLDSGNLPGAASREDLTVRNSGLLKSSLKVQQGSDWNIAARHNLMLADKWELSVGIKEGYGKKDAKPDSYSFQCSYNGAGWLSSVVLGSYNCRFGQGLAMSSGFSLQQTGKASSASRNPSLLSPYRSYNSDSALRGLAAGFSLSSFQLTAFLSHPGLGGANLSWYNRNGQIGLTSYASEKDAKISADFRWNIRGLDIWGELAFDLMTLKPACISGLRFSPVSRFTFACLLRYYPEKYTSAYSAAYRSSTKCSDEHGITLLSDWSTDSRKYTGNIALDLVRKPSLLSQADSKINIIDAVNLRSGFTGQLSEYLKTEGRFNFRYRSYNDIPLKTELRSDLIYNNLQSSASGRVHLLYSEKFAALISASYGRVFRLAAKDAESLTFEVNFRQIAFYTSGWNDRIYCYIRDVPGSFNVPAMYGRGLCTSMLACFRFPFGLKLHTFCFASYLTDRMKSKLEFRLQLSYDLFYQRSKAG